MRQNIESATALERVLSRSYKSIELVKLVELIQFLARVIRHHILKPGIFIFQRHFFYIHAQNKRHFHVAQNERED